MKFLFMGTNSSSPILDIFSLFPTCSGILFSVLPGAHLILWEQATIEVIPFFRDKSVNDHVVISTKKEQQTKWVSYLTPKANEEVKITK